MRKAGWAVWLAEDIDGSYEEGPPSLIDSAKRDRRWCQGNMQHAWLLTARGFRPASRFHLLMGVMGYVSSPLWLLFMMLCTIHVFAQVTAPVALGPGGAEDHSSLFGYEIALPAALTLFVLTMLMLFLPKLVSVIVTLGSLASVAVPRFVNMNGDAAAAARSGVAAGLNSSIQMVHSRWLAQGSPATVTLDGGLTVTMNAGGYPDVGTTYNSAGSCATLVGRLLSGATPAAAADCTGVTVPLRTQFSGGACQVHACPTDFPTPIALSATSAI